jgi:hypothetical protein
VKKNYKTNNEIKKMKIGILIIGTNKYKCFFSQLYNSFEKNVLTNHDKTYFYFTDDLTQNVPHNVKMIFIKSESWPLPTLFRYNYMLKAKDDLCKMDYLFYTDIDMCAINTIGDEILPDYLLGVAHPGFFKKGVGTPEKRLISRAYIGDHEFREYYICGGFQGGTTKEYIKAMEIMNEMIQNDYSKNIIPVWNDESIWNRYYVTNQKFYKILTPEYCYPECKYKNRNIANYQTIIHLTPRLLALDKNHKEFQI